MKAHFALLCVSLIYAANYTIAKEVMPKYLSPDALVFCRILTGMIIFWLLSSINYEKIEKKDFGRIMICGLLGSALNMLMFFKGLSLTTPINASLIMLLSPIIVLIASSIIIKERITNIKILGILIGIFGAGILISKGQSIDLNSTGLLGDLFICINATSYAIYLVLVRQLMQKYQAFTVLRWVFTFGFIFVFPFTIKSVLDSDFRIIPQNIWFAISFILIAVTVLTYLFNAFALKHVKASVVSVYIYLQPLWASIIALSFGKDILTPTKIMAYVLILIGVLLVSRPNKKLNRKETLKLGDN
jgi:drug/metabolite transporter (DMT)-like permease